jgi:histidinol-phosphatase (PHP family)
MNDYHVHCDYSLDAVGSAEDYALRAGELGMDRICFTTHCDLDPERLSRDGWVRLRGETVDVTSDWVTSYVEDVRRTGRRLEGPEVFCGLEIGYVPGIEDRIEEVIGAHDFDFVLGAVHTLEGVDIISSRESGDYYRRRTPREVCREYFRIALEAVRSNLFDSLAHLDIYKRTGLDFYGPELETAHRGLVEPVLEEMARTGVCLEVNSGPLRKGRPHPYPAPEILSGASRAGVAGVTFGSDCHRPEDLASGYVESLAAARNAGYLELTVFEKRRARTIPMERLQP